MIEKIVLGFGTLMMILTYILSYISKRKPEEWHKKHAKPLTFFLILGISSFLLTLLFFIFTLIMLFVTIKW